MEVIVRTKAVPLVTSPLKILQMKFSFIFYFNIHIKTQNLRKRIFIFKKIKHSS